MQLLHLQDPSNSDLANAEKESLQVVTHFTLMEEAHLKQKSRIKWLKLGDSKTGFFHKVVRARQSKNRLLSVYNAEGEKLEDHKAVSQEAVSFFQLGGDPTLERELVAEIIGIFYFTFYQEDRCLLSLPVEAEKIKRTMFSLNSNKAPGPDGYSAHFFKSAWEIVNQDVIEAIKSLSLLHF